MSEVTFLDALYDAAVNPAGWAPVMATFADMIGGTSSLLTRFSIVDGSGSAIRSRSDAEASEIYRDYYADRNPLHRVEDPDSYISNWRPKILTDEDWMPKEALLRSEFHNDFLRPRDIHSHLMIRLALVGEECCVLNVHRPQARGQFDRRDLELAAHYHQHLIRAFELSRKLSAGGELSGYLGSLFDYSEHGLFLLDRRSRVLKLNAAAEKIAKAKDGLRVTGARLAANTAETTRRLEGLVAAAASADPGRRTGGSMALRTADRARPLSVTVVPLRSEGLEVFRSEPAALVCVTDLEAGIRVPEQRIRELFGLTRAEARMAMALFEGARASEAADTLGVSVNTAKVHIGRIFEKTGVNRQAELVALMMRTVGLALD